MNTPIMISIILIICLALIFRIVSIIKKVSPARPHRILVAAILPLLLLAFLTDDIARYFNNFIQVLPASIGARGVYLVLAIIIALVVREVGKKVKQVEQAEQTARDAPAVQAAQTSRVRWQKIYVAVLSSVGVLLLYTTAQGILQHLHLFMFVLILVVGLAFIFEDL